MRADIIFRGKVRSVLFPKNSYQLDDFMDEMRNTFPFTVRVSELFSWDCVNNEFQIESREDLLRLNLLVQRIDEMNEPEEAKMFALMTKYPKADISELLAMTYGLDSIEAYVCCNDDELTELAFDNDWLPVFEDCPHDIIDYLDSEKVAAEINDNREGYMYNGYYVEPEGFIAPDICTELPEPVKGFFRLQLAADCDGRIDRDKAEWLILPCSKDELIEFEQRHGTAINRMICIKAESALPMISPHTVTQTDISELNKLAEKLSVLSKDEFIKLKAVMEMGEVSGIDRTMDVVSRLDEFDFDPNPMDESVFGKIFLYNTLPVGFDTEVFSTADLGEFGISILSAKGGMMTSYGVVSGQGQELYTSIYSDQSQTEDEEINEETEMILS